MLQHPTGVDHLHLVFVLGVLEVDVHDWALRLPILVVLARPKASVFGPAAVPRVASDVLVLKLDFFDGRDRDRADQPLGFLSWVTRTEVTAPTCTFRVPVVLGDVNLLVRSAGTLFAFGRLGERRLVSDGGPRYVFIFSPLIIYIILLTFKVVLIIIKYK